MAATAADRLDPRIRAALRLIENADALPDGAGLAAEAGLSVSYFSRLFTEQLGVSPARYALHYRLRHAAGRLRYTDDPCEEVARDFGYASQASFVRAFAAFFGEPPGRFRRRVRIETPAAEGRAASGVRLEVIAPIVCLARRYMGPRSEAPSQWRDFHQRLPPGLSGEPRLGLGYDDPRVTPPDRIRYDCAVRVDAAFRMPHGLAAEGFEVLTTPAGRWACAEVADASDVSAGYARILGDWLPAHRGWTLEGDPFLEIFKASPDPPRGTCGPTVCLRVRRVGDVSSPNMAGAPGGGRDLRSAD